MAGDPVPSKQPHPEPSAAERGREPHRGRVLTLDGLMLLPGVGLFLLVRDYGETLPVPSASSQTEARQVPTSRSDILFHVLLALTAVVALGRALRSVFVSFGQPPVIGEVVAGILLGPSFLGRLAPNVAAYLLPPLDPVSGNGLSRAGRFCYSPQTSQDEGRQGGLPWQARRRRW